MPIDSLAIPRDARDLPAALARWHRDHHVGDRLRIAGRLDAPVPLATLALGAGLDAGRPPGTFVRARTLPDLLGPGLGVVVVGLNPSLVAADAGVPFVGPTNRFWPAALAAGLVPADRDPWAAFACGVGFTDLVKRATPRADGLRRADYAQGASRLAALVAWLRPQVVCFAGLTGYRQAVDATAAVGTQPERFAGAATYVMPNPSGANAHVSRAALVEHFGQVRSAARLARVASRSS
ncbi:MAG: mismatch-specific DNA-glycosylase [Acidimicrobiia bacterium]